ncbi:MAG TPA: hypothetical protein VE439_03830 [Anaerolineae bacterium]|jgi:hypothetical protein|nr:hypothetical protein [Anaerolineae bacterium]
MKFLINLGRLLSHIFSYGERMRTPGKVAGGDKKNYSTTASVQEIHGSKTGKRSDVVNESLKLRMLL